ncbi:MAG: hypothetical protein KIS61_36750, partial [Candidatus Eremiobacteraeota bacterium]|nr:hypothetical protein [Candidatus Eremiobacteraeota bacterium]
MRLWIVALIFSLALVGCGINSVTKAELEGVKVGDVLIYRHQVNGRSWMYGNKVTRIEGDTIYFVPSINTATSKNSDIASFAKDAPEDSIKKADLLKYETEQGDEKK